MIVNDYPETKVLGDVDCSLCVRLAVDAHVIVVDRVGTIRVEVDPDSIVALSLH